MGFFKKYKSSISLIILGGLVFLFTIKFDSVLTSFKIGLDAVMPLVWGVLIAFVLNIIVKRFEKIYFPSAESGWKHSTRRPVCVVLAIFTILLAILPRRLHGDTATRSFLGHYCAGLAGFVSAIV